MNLEVFPGRLIQQIGFPRVTFASQLASIHRSGNAFPDLPRKTLLLLAPQSNKGLAFSILSLHQKYQQYRNINLLSIVYAFQPLLRTD